jgi:lipid II:glycine glycyltransferase (peptidoglycan interpeptide bridge formation enzyme)
MKIEPQDYLQKLVEVYQAQCNQYLQERLSLQAQLDLVLKELEKVEAKLQEVEKTEVVDVNTNTDT